jgi:hypothetical protein
LDESNNFYLSNLKTKSINCIQNELKFDNKTTKAFRLSSSSGQEQFLFSDRDWLNGYKFSCDEKSANPELKFSLCANDKISQDFLCAFYTQKRNELFIIGWNDNPKSTN